MNLVESVRRTSNGLTTGNFYFFFFVVCDMIAYTQNIYYYRYSKAAHAGSMLARFALARMALNAATTPQEKENARQLFAANAAGGCQKSQRILDLWHD
jgi:TPR repeat protein